MKDSLWVIECWTGSIWRPATGRGVYFDKRTAENNLLIMNENERQRKKPTRRVALYRRVGEER